MKSEKVYFFIIRCLKIVKMWHERTSFFQVMEKKWEKKERKDTKKKWNEWIYLLWWLRNKIWVEKYINNFKRIAVRCSFCFIYPNFPSNIWQFKSNFFPIKHDIFLKETANFNLSKIMNIFIIFSCHRNFIFDV